MLSGQHLRFLVALADELNFSRAAEVCHVTQPTLSNGLKELEGRLGVPLAERTRRSVALTPIGADMAGRARTILGAMADMEDRARAHADRFEGTLRIGAIPTVAPYLIPRILPALKQRWPGLQIYFREDLSDALIQQLRGLDLDAILLAEPYEMGDLERAPLFEDGYHLAAPQGHPLAQCTRVGDRDLAGAELLLLEPGHCLQRHALTAFPAAATREDPEFAATSLATLIFMVEEGLGITLLPDLAVRAGAADGRNIALTPLPDALPRRVVMAWRPTSPYRQAFRDMAAVIAAAVRGENTP